jgi:hypothetical protein
VITANPFGVGASGERREQVTGRCACCGLGYLYERWPGGDTGPHCAHCQRHAPSPDALQESGPLARLLDHEPRIKAYADQAIDRATRYEREAKQAKAEGARQAASALRQRDLYRTLLAEVYKLHADSKGYCKACNCRYPCATINLLERAGGGANNAIIRAAARRDSDMSLDWE